MDGTIAPDLDPLDLEVLERALEGTPDAIKTPPAVAELESDEELERALRGELAEMIRANGVSDADALLDIFIDGKTERVYQASNSNPTQFLGLRVGGPPSGSEEAGFLSIDIRDGQEFVSLQHRRRFVPDVVHGVGRAGLRHPKTVVEYFNYHVTHTQALAQILLPFGTCQIETLLDWAPPATINGTCCSLSA